jgi:hypothetical protein
MTYPHMGLLSKITKSLPKVRKAFAMFNLIRQSLSGFDTFPEWGRL